MAAQPMNQILWQTAVDQQPWNWAIHYGEPIFTPSNTVIVPVKTGYSQSFALEAFNGNTGTLLWTAASNYVEPSYSWLPPYQPAYDPISNRVYFEGEGGTLFYISNPDNPGSSAPTPAQVAFFGTANYVANESAYNSSIFINTPLTVDNSGNVYFGFTETGSNPSGINDGGIARISPTGGGAYVLASTAVGQSNDGKWNPALGSAPALSNDGSILYVGINDSGENLSGSEYDSFLIGLNSTTLAPMSSVFLKDPDTGNSAGLIDQSTAAPMVAPDGTVFMGVFGNPSNGSRGYMLHFSANLAVEYTPGAFGWDDTASIIPTSMVPSYTGSSSYLILTKYNNYTAGDAGSYGGNGTNAIAVLDPNATQTDPNNDPNTNLQVMAQVMTMTSPTEDSDWINKGYPDAVREFCTNGTAVDPATDSVFINNEDGYAYRWDLASDTITQAVEITDGIGEPYTPTAIGPNGVIYAINGGTLFALGGYADYNLTDTSSLAPATVGESVTFTTTVTSASGDPVPTGTITYSYTSGVNDPLNSTPLLLGTATLVNGQASSTTSALPPAHYHLTATYSGDANYAAGSTTLVQTVLGTVSTALSASTLSPAAGQNVTFTATVTPTGTSFAPLGSVTFLNGGAVLGTSRLNSSSQATFAISSLPLGIDAITAVYSGDLNFAGSTSSIADETVIGTITTNATPSPVTGATTNLSVQGTETSVAGLTYTWSVTRAPSGAATPTFSLNGTNAAQNTTVTFYLAGNYTFLVTVADSAGAIGTSTVAVTVNQTLTSIGLSPASVTLPVHSQQQFQASALDQFGQKMAMQPGSFVWSIASGGIGSINNGQYSSPNSGTGSATIQATASGLTGTATVVVKLFAPVITQPASANQNPVTGNQTQLQVQASDPQGFSLSYAWSVTSQPSGATTPAFNSANSNKTTVTFYQAGSYTFTVTVTDSSGLSTTNSVSVSVVQTLTRLSITPATVTMANGATQQFAAAALDQFGSAMASQPTFTWQVNSGQGTISSGGLYTAPSSGTGNFQVKVSVGGKSAQAIVKVTTIPLAPSNLTAQASLQNGAAQVKLQWNNNSNNETGFLIERYDVTTNTWTTFTLTGTFSNWTDTSVDLGNTYEYEICAYNPLGDSPFSNVATVTTP